MLAFAVLSLSRVALLGAAAGVYLFVRGFLLLARQRLFAQIGTSTISRISPGLVEVTGAVTGPHTLQAPVTGDPCFLYRVTAWQPGQSKRNAPWEKVAEETQHAPFFLNDTTGLLLVDAEGAELDLADDFREEFDVSAFSENDDLPPEVSAFLARNGIAPQGRFRIEELTIKPNDLLFVVGTATESYGGRRMQAAAAQNAVSKRPEDAESPREVVRISDTGVPAAASEMTLQGKIAAALLKAGIQNGEIWESPAGSASTSSPPISQVVMDDDHGSSQSVGEGAVMKVVLRKGKDNPTFLISWRSRQEVMRSLNWKSFSMIWGGIGLILIGIYVLLAQ